MAILPNRYALISLDILYCMARIRHRYVTPFSPLEGPTTQTIRPADPQDPPLVESNEGLVAVVYAAVSPLFEAKSAL